MLLYPIIWIVNAWIWLFNGWRRLLRRRVEYVRIELSGALPEFAPRQSWLQRRLSPAPEVVALQKLRRIFERVADEPEARGVLLVVKGLSAGWAGLESLRDELARLRASGKRVVVYLLDGDVRAYFLACAADEILMPPSAFLNLLGLHLEVTFLKDSLELLGIEAEVVAVSPYKAAGERFVRSDISPENREQLERLLEARFEALVAAIAEGRKLDPERVRALIDRAPYVASAALEQGLLDGACYEDELAARLYVASPSGDDGKPEVRIDDWQAAKRALRLPYRVLHRKLIGVVSLQGAITAGASRRSPVPLPLIGGEQAGADSLTQALRKAERNKRVVAVVLHVDSPGGDAYASDLIWREVLRLKRQKPVVVLMGDVAASGGYYVAAPANTIVAQPGTLTGSIGVISLRPIAAGLYEKLRVNTVELARGQRSGLLTVSRPPSEDERAALREVVFTIYQQFKERVCAGRGLGEAQLEPIAGGRVWTGREGRELGLIDVLGGLPEAVAKARELAGLPADPRAPLVRFGGSGERLAPQPFPSAELPLLLAGLPELVRELSQTRVLARLPFEIR
jgi:protease-4